MAIITTEREYKQTLIKLKTFQQNEKQLEKKELTKEQNNTLLAPLIAFNKQMEYEIKEYEGIKKGNIPEYMLKMENLGLLLIALRIKNGWTQAELGSKLGVNQSQIARNERNEYHGVSLPTIKKLLKVYNQEILFNLN